MTITVIIANSSFVHTILVLSDQIKRFKEGNKDIGRLEVNNLNQGDKLW